MELNLLKGKPISDPNDEQIIAALDKVYRGKLDGVVLTKDQEQHQFIQVACWGYYLEYKESPSSNIYSADEVPQEVCQQIFLDYASGGESWREMVDWEATLDSRGQPLRK
jgi:hypothetical protein